MLLLLFWRIYNQVDQLCLVQISNDVVHLLGQSRFYGLFGVWDVLQWFQDSIVKVARQEIISHDVHVLDDVVLEFHKHLQFAHILNALLVGHGVAWVVAIGELIRQVVLLYLFNALDVLLCEGEGGGA